MHQLNSSWTYNHAISTISTAILFRQLTVADILLFFKTPGVTSCVFFFYINEERTFVSMQVAIH